MLLFLKFSTENVRCLLLVLEFGILNTCVVDSLQAVDEHLLGNGDVVERDAALMVRDAEAIAKGMDVALELLADKERLQQLSRNISALGIADAAERVVRQIEKEW